MKHPKDAASPATSGQGLGTLTGSGLINKHFMPVMPPFTTEEHKRAYALMVRAHFAAIDCMYMQARIRACAVARCE